MWRGTLSIPALFVAAAVSAADGVPRLSVESACRATQRGDPQEQQIVEACLRDETNAERQLAGMWARASAASRATCIENQRSSRSQSYVELLTCVQLMQGTTLQPTDPH
jgi:hypothetical protein